jgi:hypothetical protein
MFFLATGCSSLRVKVNYEPGYNFGALKTYAWFKGEARRDDPLNIDPAIRIPYMQSADTVLKGKGFQLAEGTESDFVVSLVGRTESVYRYSGGTLSIESLDVGNVWEGTLVVEIMDSKTQAVIWSCRASRAIRRGLDPEQRDAYSLKITKRVLKKFPPE